MGDVIVRHGEDDELGHRAGVAVESTGALEDRGQIGVHVAGVAASAGDLLAGGGHFAQRLAVVGHVGEDHEHVEAAFEGEVLGGRRAPDAGVRRRSMVGSSARLRNSTVRLRRPLSSR